ncbi:WxL protein peptidoglycan domain-containing protein [Microbacterium sp. NPDC091313]
MTRSLHHTLAAVALAVSAIVATAAAPAAAASADTSGALTWGVRTADTAQGDGRQNFAYTVDPGDRLDDALVVSNHDDAPLELDVYAADGFTTQSGQLDLLPRAEDSTGIGTWISVSTGRITIPPGETAQVPFRVSVPANASPGDYLGGIVTSLPQPEQAEGIAVDRRLGIRVQMRVGGALAPSLAVEDLTVGYEPSLNPFAGATANVEYTVRNTGNTRLSALQSVAVSGPFGLLRADLPGVDEVPDLLPGDTWHVSARTDALVPLFWTTVDVTLAPRGPAGFAGAGDPALSTTSAGMLTIPVGQLALLVVVAALATGTVLAVRRSRRRRRAAEEARIEAAVAAALAEEHAPVVR